MEEPGPCWVDGHLVDRHAPALSPTDSAFASGRGCYTTARYRGGSVRFLERHSARLVRDAQRLGVGPVSRERVAEGLVAVGRAAFGDGEGIVRIQASRGGDGRVHLCGVPRAPGPEPEAWRAILSRLVHEGPMPWSGAKVSNHLLFALAGEGAREAGADEAFLADREGYVVEGSRSNLLAVLPGGSIVTPDLARGGVQGVGLEVLCERVPEIRSRHLAARGLREARELIAVNSIRGPRPIVRLDGEPVGDGLPGPVAARLAAAWGGD